MISTGVDHDAYVLEAGRLYIVGPNMLRMLLSRLRVQNRLPIHFVLIRVHDQNWYTLGFGPGELRKHRSQLEVVVRADAALPHAGTNFTRTLNEDERFFLCVLLLLTRIWAVEFLAHVDRASDRLFTIIILQKNGSQLLFGHLHLQ